MKNRTKQFIQHLSHDIEDEDKAEEYLEESLPLIGLVVMYFNSLEKSLDSFICEIVSDRSDAPGLIVIQKLMYAAKVISSNGLAKIFIVVFRRRQTLTIWLANWLMWASLET